jgi:hypothetical protein
LAGPARSDHNPDPIAPKKQPKSLNDAVEPFVWDGFDWEEDMKKMTPTFVQTILGFREWRRKRLPLGCLGMVGITA